MRQSHEIVISKTLKGLHREGWNASFCKISNLRGLDRKYRKFPLRLINRSLKSSCSVVAKEGARVRARQLTRLEWNCENCKVSLPCDSMWHNRLTISANGWPQPCLRIVRETQEANGPDFHRRRVVPNRKRSRSPRKIWNWIQPASLTSQLNL